jgi:TolB-like protein
MSGQFILGGYRAISGSGNHRRLAAILVADVVGYTRLVEKDTDGTVAAWKAARTNIIEPGITRHLGRIVKLTGDGFLAEFPVAMDAVKCAVAMQQELKESSLDFRMGVNLGDIIDDGKDIHGEGVNIAARIEALAEHGGVCISGGVYDQVRNRLDHHYDDMGEHQVKHVSVPVRVYQIFPEKAVAVQVPARQTNSFSIAVLPFDNMSGDPEQEYFADGLTEDLITDLSKISGLFVIARNSSFIFKGMAVDTFEVGKKLGVAHLLEGSVRKINNRVRINAQLIDAATGGHLWAERYDREIDDIFALQDEILSKIISALEVTLHSTQMRTPKTNSVEAYELGLKARAKFFFFTPDTNADCISLYEQAIAIDSNFSDAWSGQVFPYQAGWTFMWPGYDDGLVQAKVKAEKAIQLTPLSSSARSRLGWVEIFSREHDKAVANYEKSLELEPNNAIAYALFAEVLNFAGDPKRAIEMAKSSFRFDPLAPPYVHGHLGHSHLLLGDLKSAYEHLGKAIEMAPSFPVPRYLMSVTEIERGNIDAAKEHVRVLQGLFPRASVVLFDGRNPYADDNQRTRIMTGLRAAGLPEN